MLEDLGGGQGLVTRPGGGHQMMPGGGQMMSGQQQFSSSSMQQSYSYSSSSSSQQPVPLGSARFLRLSWDLSINEDHFSGSVEEGGLRPKRDGK